MIAPLGWQLLTPHELAGEDKARLVIGPFGSSLRTSDYRTAGVPLVFVRDIRAKDFSAPRHFVSPEKARELRAHVVEPGDVLITKMGDPPGDTCVYTGQEPGIITADCIRLRPSDGFDARYISYVLQAPAVRNQVASITSGVAQRKMSLARFRGGLSIPIPSLGEQLRVVEVLEDHLSRLDAAERSLADARKRLEVFGLAHLTHVRSRLAGTDNHRIAEFADTSLGKMLDAKKQVGTPTPYLRNINVRWGAFDLSDLHTTPLTDADRLRLELRDGDVLACEGGEPGRNAVWRRNDSGIAYQKALHRLRVRDPALVLPEYLSLMLTEAIRSGRCDRLLTGTTIKHLPQEKLRVIEIPLPDAAAQHRLVSEHLALSDSASRMAAEVERRRVQANQLRRSLLAAAFSGRMTTHPDRVVSATEEGIA